MLDDLAQKDSLSLDIHFDSRTGIKYKRVIVVTDLDMMGNNLKLLLKFYIIN